MEIWSDVVCPWCYVGKRRFEAAVAAWGGQVEVVYRPFQLDPTAPPGATQPVVDAYAKKFGGPERAAQIIAHLTQVAAESGLDLRLDRAQRANTLLAHRALWMAEHDPAADQAALKEQLLAAYFTEGRDIGDPDVVADCAGRAGMDAEALRTALDTDAGVAEVAEQLATAASHGITAVPTYVFDGRWAVPGAQDVEVFRRVLDRLEANDG